MGNFYVPNMYSSAHMTHISLCYETYIFAYLFFIFLFCTQYSENGGTRKKLIFGVKLNHFWQSHVVLRNLAIMTLRLHREEVTTRATQVASTQTTK